MRQASGPGIIETITAPSLRRLYTYWDGLRGGRTFPARRDLDPVEFAYALGHVLLIDVLYEPQRFRFRLHGTDLVWRAGYDMTGKMVDELPHHENRAVLLERCRSVIATRQPWAIRNERVVDGRIFGYEALWLPLSNDGEVVNMLMGGLIYLDPPAAGRLADSGPAKTRQIARI